MEEVTLEVDGAAAVKIEQVGGDLRLEAVQGKTITARAGDREELSLEQEGDEVVVRSDGDCQLIVPEGSRVTAGKVGGDARILGPLAEVRLELTGGDLTITQAASLSSERVGGDVLAREIDGGISLRTVGGDAILEQVSGGAELKAIGGDLVVRALTGVLTAAAGGDAFIDYNPSAGSRAVVQAGGEILCSLPEAASVEIQIQAGGTIRVPEELHPERENGGVRVRLGDGAASLWLTAGGDARLQLEGSERSTAYTIGIDEAMAEKVADHIADLGQSIGVIGSRLGPRIARRVQRAVNRAVRRSIHAQVVVERKLDEFERRMGPAASSGDPVSNEERMAVLRLVEEGKITVAEAEQLLEALERAS